MKKIIMLMGFSLVGISIVLVAGSRQRSYVPPEGFVPNEKTAIRIAVAVWSPIYGEEKIEAEKPFVATLKNGVWMVHGSLPKGLAGGVAIAQIAKRDGRILQVSHGR
jgi:hypothetical protein